jgi:hypothetical protein
MTQEQCRALEQIWSHDIWTAIPLNNEAQPPAGRDTTATRNDKSTSETPLYNDDENEDDYSGDEMSDEAEGSEDRDDGSDHMSSVLTGMMERAIETTERLPDGRRLYGNGSQLHACGSSGTPDEVVADLVLQSLHFLVAEEYEDGRPSSTLLIYFASVLGISIDGLTFERPSNYTPKLSGLIHCIRLVLFEISLPHFPHPMLGSDARPRRGQLEVLNGVRVEKMCLGSQAPLGELLSLRSYGRASSRSDGTSFRVHWSDDGQTVSWVDGSLTMAQFRGIGRGALEHAISCCGRVMYRWSPSIDISTLKDVLSDISYGYSFVTDPARCIP